MQDNAVRSLVRLQSSGSTSRLLNLLRLHHEHGQTEEHVAKPFFQIPALNKAILVKHRLRPHELELFDGQRTLATKLILALDSEDLRSGGRFAFVGQRGWHHVLNSIANDDRLIAGDRRTLELLDGMPSFDPFLLREHLRRAEVTPAASYFDITPADTEQMVDYLQGELKPLVQLSTGGSGLGASTAAIVQKLMSPTAQEELEPLGRTLRLTPDQYAEGVFCWKGFLYYKWRLAKHAATATKLIERIHAAKLVGPAERAEKIAVAEAKPKVESGLRAAMRSAAGVLKVYDDSFKLMVLAEDPTAFRDFLLDAPATFLRLGERIGAVDHVEGFWNFRFPGGTPAEAKAEELTEILQDFLHSLGDPAPQPQARHVELA